MYDLIIIGAGPSAIFAAINAKKKNKDLKILILEKNSYPLNKLKLSGGGRCNLTNAVSKPAKLASFYPRGKKELISMFHIFNSQDTIKWFEDHKVILKVEDDNKVFPASNSSQTIVDTLIEEIKKLEIKISYNQNILNIELADDIFKIFEENNTFFSKKLLIATGSNINGYKWAESFGHKIITPKISLYAFNIENFDLNHLSGISFENIEAKIKNTKFAQTGALLITHYGFSGPCIIKLSSFTAEYLFEKQYKEKLLINYLYPLKQPDVYSKLKSLKQLKSNKYLIHENIFNLPKTFWKHLIQKNNDLFSKRLSEITHQSLYSLSEKLTLNAYQINGKTPNKNEFVTAGGIDLKQIDVKKMESKIVKNLFFAGEILNIDALCGGFNLQNCWTTGFIVSQNI